MTIEGGTAIVLAYVLVSNGSSFGCASTAANSAERRRVTYPSINRALTMWCDHPGTKAVAFLVNHVNRASHLRSATNREPPPKAMAASRSQHDPLRVLALVGPTLGLAARITNL